MLSKVVSKDLMKYFKTNAQKRGFHYYLAGLLGESKRKNITQITYI